MQAIPAKMDLGDRVSRVASSATRVATTTVTDSRLRNEARIPSALEAHWLQRKGWTEWFSRRGDASEKDGGRQTWTESAASHFAQPGKNGSWLSGVCTVQDYK